MSKTINNMILGTCRLFDKPLLKTILKDYTECRKQNIRYDSGEYYQNEHLIARYGSKDATIYYKLWILNGEGTKNIKDRIDRALTLFQVKTTNRDVIFMIHTPTPNLEEDLIDIRNQLKNEVKILKFKLCTSNFYKEHLLTFKNVFGFYPAKNQLEINLNSLQLNKTFETLKFMNQNHIRLQAYGLIRRGQYMKTKGQYLDNNGEYSKDYILDKETLRVEDIKFQQDEFWQLEYAFGFALKIVNKIFPDIEISPIISPNRGTPCINWYLNNNIETQLKDYNLSNHREFPAFKDSPDYDIVGLGNNSLRGKSGHIYMAGPLFDRGQITNRYGDEKFIKDNFPQLSTYNPINHNINCWEGEDAKPISCLTFYEKDMEEINKADIMFADLDSMDPGTITEIGIFCERIRQGVKPNLRLIVMASNWEYWTSAIPGEANPTLGINDFLEGCIRDCGFFIKDLDSLKNYLEDYTYDIEVDNNGHAL